jgi:fumarate reductase subunit C
VIAAYFAFAGALSQFGFQAFVLEAQAHPVSKRFALIQDTPEYLTSYGALVPELVGLIVLSLAIGIGRAYDFARSILLGLMLTFVLVQTLRHPPPPPRPFFLIVAYGVVVVLGLIALATTISLEGPWLRNHPTADALRSRLFPPELVFLALFLVWLAQFAYDGMLNWYEGAFLAVPVVLLFVHELSRMSFSLRRYAALHVRIAVPAVAPVLVGLWLSAGGIGIVQERVYEDAQRYQLTADFTTPALRGIKAYPLTQQRFDALVAEVQSQTKPGDPIFFLPDFGLLYEATGRRNPTRIDWYNEAFLTPAVTAQVLADLERDPPKVVFLQTQREGTYQRDQAPIDWPNTKWAPIYDYLMAHYTQVGSVQDIKVMVQKS